MHKENWGVYTHNVIPLDFPKRKKKHNFLQHGYVSKIGNEQRETLEFLDEILKLENKNNILEEGKKKE